VGQVLAKLIEAVHVDVAVRAVFGALAAAYAPVLDDDLAGVAAANRANGTADHAVRVHARATGAGHQELIETQSLANKARDAVVGIGAGLGTLVAARTFLQVQNQEALGFVEALAQIVA